MASRLRRRWIVAVFGLLMIPVVVHLSIKVYDLTLKAASLENLRDVAGAYSDHLDAVNRAGDDWQELLVSKGAVEQERFTDPRSGQPYRFVSLDPAHAPFDPSQPCAYSPLSDAPVSWWPGDTRGGCILYADGHGQWHRETEFRKILADHSLAP
jgi:hypothetical protein